MDDQDTIAKRIDALNAYGLFDGRDEPALDAIVRAAAAEADAPIAMISLLDDRRQWFRSKLGVEHDGDPIEHSICAHAIAQEGIFVVPDARADPRFSDFPAVQAEGGIRFYAGVPLRLADGAAIGTLCVIDSEPREAIDDHERAALEALARRAVAAFELRRDLRANGHLDVAETDAGFWIDQAIALLDRAVVALERAGPSAALGHLEQAISLLDKQRGGADEGPSLQDEPSSA